MDARPFRGYGNDSRQTGPFVLTSEFTWHCDVLIPLSEGPAEKTSIPPTPLTTGVEFAIRRQTRPRFAFAETRTRGWKASQNAEKSGLLSDIRESVARRYVGR